MSNFTTFEGEMLGPGRDFDWAVIVRPLHLIKLNVGEHNTAIQAW